MASAIRQQKNLPTLRLSLIIQETEFHLLLRTYVGRQLLHAEVIPTSAAGIAKQVSVAEYRDHCDFRLPEQALKRIVDSLGGVQEPTQPIWLQVDRSAGHLAIVPWERLLAPSFRRPILRIPNFFIDPTFLDGPLKLALCVSAPAAKEYFPAELVLKDFIQALPRTVRQGTELDVFADAGAWRTLQDLRLGAEHRLTLHDPREAASRGLGATREALAQDMASPWLKWMESALKGRHVDAVQFICPGYFERDRGCLALARSPVDNNDQAWSHFIGAPELRRFLESVGAWMLGLYSPNRNVWTLGLRLLADNMAWTYPGCVALFEGNDQRAKNSTQSCYQFLFDLHADRSALPADGSYTLYSHPGRLQRDVEGQVRFEGPTLSSRDPRHEWLFSTLSRIGWKSPDNQESTGFKEPPLSQLPPWARSMQLMLQEELLSVSDHEGPNARGATDALKHVADLRRQILRAEIETAAPAFIKGGG